MGSVLALLALAAFIAGVPTIRGGFVGGDDHRLALNHGLVNHPSLDHAFKLFTIQHRDLYQPLPLLTFQIEFLIAQTFELFREGPDAGGWLFHLNNVILHTINTVLVFLVVRMFQEHVRRRGSSGGHHAGSPASAGLGDTIDGAAPLAVAGLAALLFAVHPFQVETIAWLNGRMMLLSTLFLLLSLLAFSSWLERPGARAAVLALVAVLLCAISKVRIGLPVLLLILAYARGRGFRRHFWSLWIPVTLLTACFAYVNVETTSDAELFQQGATYLRGPRLARVLMALAFYFEHIVWPAGLCSYYPTPPYVAWSDPIVKRSMLVVVSTLAMLAWAAWRSRVARMGVIWFFATVFATLPIFPARNVLAADRYMYVPLIGLFWLLGAAVCAAYVRTMGRSSRAVRVGLPAAAGVVLIPLLIGVGWHTAYYYETPLLKTRRVAELFPDTPRVWEPHGWTLRDLGFIEQAEAAAQMELRHDAPKVRGGAYLLMGICALDRGDVQEAIRLMELAITEDPESARSMFRLGGVYEQRGDLHKAAEYFERSVALTPMHNPSLNRLASVYRRLGRSADAREIYQRALEFSHGYDVISIMGLVELDIADGSRERLRAAQKRLDGLLAWMPENLDARANLGVVLTALGEPRQAGDVYAEVLRRDPRHVVANLNLAQLLVEAGQTERAVRFYEQAAEVGPSNLEQALAVHDFLVDRHQTLRLPAMWQQFIAQGAAPAESGVYEAWAHALAGNAPRAQKRWAEAARSDSPAAAAAAIYIALVTGDFEEAWNKARNQKLAAPAASTDRQRLLAALQYFDSRNPGIPWTFCLAGRMLQLEGNLEGASLSADLCAQVCHEPACRAAIVELRNDPGEAGSD